MTSLDKYYNKFNEDHRLTTRHGIVEFTTTMNMIHKFIGDRQNLKILDVGAGTGRYSIELCHEGHNVTAVEPVKRNLEVLRSRHEPINTWLGNSTDMSFLADDTFDITLMFGPMYHLHQESDKLKSLAEAKRVTKQNGLIFVCYLMNDYAVVKHCFIDRHILENIDKHALTEDFHTLSNANDLYSYSRIEDMDALNDKSGLSLAARFAQDGAADYIRRELNAMTQAEFDYFIKYHIATCCRPELLGASSHLADILRVPDKHADSR